PVGDAGQLVALPTAHEAEPVDQLELIVAQQVQYEATGLEDQVVAEVELVDVDGQPRHRRSDRGAHGAVRDHAVALAVALAGDGHDGRGQVAQQLIDLVGLQVWHGPILGALRARGKAAPRLPLSFILLYDSVALPRARARRSPPPLRRPRNGGGGGVRRAGFGRPARSVAHPRTGPRSLAGGRARGPRDSGRQWYRRPGRGGARPAIRAAVRAGGAAPRFGGQRNRRAACALRVAGRSAATSRGALSRDRAPSRRPSRDDRLAAAARERAGRARRHAGPRAGRTGSPVAPVHAPRPGRLRRRARPAGARRSGQPRPPAPAELDPYRAAAPRVGATGRGRARGRGTRGTG